MQMTSSKPYLIQAIYDWIVDNELTPYLLVNATLNQVEVPQEHVVNGRILLNLSPTACRGLHINVDNIVFTTRFSGHAVQIVVPPRAVLAIYAKENGRGMEFGEEYDEQTDGGTSSDVQDVKENKMPFRAVKAKSNQDRKKPTLTLLSTEKKVPTDQA